MRESDEMSLVGLVGSLVLIVAESDTLCISEALGIEMSKASKFNYSEATAEQKLRIAEKVIDEYCDSPMSKNTKQLFLDHIREVIAIESASV